MARPSSEAARTGGRGVRRRPAAARRPHARADGGCERRRAGRQPGGRPEAGVRLPGKRRGACRDQSTDRGGERRARGRRRRLPLAPGRPRPGRAARVADARGAGCRRQGVPAGARRARSTGRPARARPSRRRPDHRADDARGTARGDGRPSPPADPEVRFGFAASAPFGADVLERLAANHEVAFCLTQPDAPAGRGRGLRPAPAKLKALQLGIPVVESLDTPLDAETIVLVAYWRLIPGELLERHLWLNLHPSLLPRWRGAAPVERAIMAGDAETG